MKEIYRKLQAHLADTVPLLASVELDCGQLDNPHAPRLLFPAALLDISYPACEDITAVKQECCMLLSVRIAFRVWPGPTLPIGEHLCLVEDVYHALQGWCDDTFAPFSRLTQLPEQRTDGLKVYSIEFSTTLEE